METSQTRFTNNPYRSSPYINRSISRLNSTPTTVMEESRSSDLISKRQRLDSYIAGDITNPKGEGSSKLVQFADNVVYRLYFKGLVSDEVVAAESGERTVTAGFGVAICDVADNLLYEMKESLSDGGEVKRRGVEIRALIHGLSEAFNMGIRHVRIHCDDYPIFQFVSVYKFFCYSFD